MLTLRCAHCSRRITSDASEGAWPGGPVGPVCAAKLGALPVRAVVTASQPVKQPRVGVVRAAVNGAEWVDPAQMVLELESAC